MDKKIQIIAIVGAIIFSVFVLTSPTDPIPLPAPTTNSENDSVNILAENLKKPRAIAVADDRIFVTEQDGQIRIIENDLLLDSPLATFRTADVFDGGLIGIALHPDFNNNHFVYVFLTYQENGELWNKIIQITEFENKLQDVKIIFDKIPGSSFTNGGFLKFSPDGKLFVGTGTTSDASHLPQDLDSLSGKILRLNDDGTIPDDNPFADSPVYALGFRNPQGMTWDDEGNLYVAEFGPEKNDEINLILSGKNYGWPQVECSGDVNFEDAILCYDPSIEPGGILFYSGDAIDFDYPFILASMRASNLYQLDFEEGLSSQKSILSGIGRVRDVVESHDGSLYVITSNTDGKGFPDSTDDKLLRIIK
ncbi:MAG TPA: PQQ-dependent sugar dehydrogenase [Nitrosopumilus sp.]|jgi:glucose/arabinose dehydrogenase|nr:PQQ-dependent sugar dehydrogenase [Nitrosopumilus sp.]HJM26006.1 PQQ-dependent sugar dehydrogenase [Nitrosopumilus sp.]HJO31234.1 PQQ-dependent sugar dehydrogenase [Nitrosopumilus sp.]|tara:strand:- start:53 stop:1144 length:1092 start_codon:yes stop_codon:yes gene_type:complete